MARLLSITCILISCCCLIESRASEYQLDSETLSQCELLRGVAVARQQGEVPHCTHDGSFRCSVTPAGGSVGPGSCEVRSRRLLHSTPPPPSPSPPQCAADGSFLPVQCKLINTSDSTELDLLLTFNRFPEAFDTFTSFRKVFPTVSSYCFCADSRGREQENTAMAASSVYLPSCEGGGAFSPRQCGGGQCWCSDPEGREGVFPSVGEALSALSLSSPPACRRPCLGGGSCRTSVGAWGWEEWWWGGTLPRFRGESPDRHQSSEGPQLPVQPAGERATQEPPSSEGRCSRALDDVTVFRQEVQSIINLSNSSHLPLGYGFLLAHGLQLTPEELQTGQSEKELLCWCVDEDGEYIADSLTSRSLHLPKCLTRCQRAQAHSLLSGWMKGSSTSAYQPTCEEKGGADGWCVNPRTGETLQTATQSAAGQLTCPSWCELQGSQCRPDGSFIPLQCDVTSCWCVSEDGQEVGGTRTSRQTGRTPSCDPEGRQSCDLVCHRGYHNSLPVGSFLCDSEGQRWTGDPPLSGACQTSPLSLLLSALALVVLPVSSVSLCDGSSVHLQCVGDDAMKLTFRWSSALTDLPISDLPDLHHAGLFLNESRLLEGVQGFWVISVHVYIRTKTGFYDNTELRLFPREGACLQCVLREPIRMKRGRTSATNVPEAPPYLEHHLRGLRCSDRGDFLSAQPDFLSGRWRCVSSEGAELQWTNREEPLTDNQCSDLLRFQTVSGSDLIVGAEDAEVLKTMTSDLTSCVQACAAEPTCHHVALFNTQTQCELYSTHTLNTHCNTSAQTQGFLGNPEAELFDWLSCSLRVRAGLQTCLSSGRKSFPLRYERVRMRKALSGVFRTQVFRRTSLSDALLFCSDGCSADACCHGFTLNLNTCRGVRYHDDTGEHGEHGSSLLCGWLRAPSVLMCGDEDWDVIGQAAANRECGAGLTYNEQQRSFLFDFGGQQFDITSVQQRVCGAYDNPLRAACRPLLDRAPNNTYSKKVDLSGPVRSFYERVSFQKMVSYSVRSRVTLRENTPLSEGFRSVSGVVMRILVAVASASCGTPNLQHVSGGLSLISLGVQTCSEDTRPPGGLRTAEPPHQNQTGAAGLCPWISGLLSGSSLLVDSSLSTYDIIHLSRDIAAGNRDATRIGVSMEAESCVGVALSEEGGATRCVLYPDTSTCGLSSAPNAPSPASSCRLVIREPASQVYLKTGDNHRAGNSQSNSSQSERRSRTITEKRTANQRAANQRAANYREESSQSEKRTDNQRREQPIREGNSQLQRREQPIREQPIKREEEPITEKRTDNNREENSQSEDSQ
ncbi:hypothetical protein F7725_017788 [Dissostichus mawsoni]|uniref:Thyroglobulin n=1 Tax=Dissostichus mawsoni TaxID=36200 RepID=A0A7J5XQ55_DISMA|nr:hypothetical protein F7725_017788 [Dissostichus mawsoni]